MEKQIKSSKLSKILIITSIAAGVTLSGAFLIYKHNKENKQYKRNSHSNFSITIHLSKDNLKSDGVQDISIDKNKIKGKEKSIEENELSEIQDFDEYISSLPSSEEKNFFLSLFDKFMNIFSKKEDLLDDTIIITKPNEALYSLSDSVEIDENNDTIIITKTNEADGIPNIDDNNYNTKDNVKILNEVIEQTINLVNNNNNSNNNSSNNNGSDIDNDNDNDSAVDSSSSTGTTTTTTTTTGNNRKNFKKSITITSLDNSIGSKNSNGTNPTVNNYYNEPVSAQSSTSTLIGKRENLENLQNSSSSFYNSNSMKNMMSEIEMEDVIETGDEGDAEDELEHDDDDNDDEYHNNYTNTNTNTNTGKHFTYRKRKETITSSNYNKRNDEFIDSENEYVAPSTPKMSFTERHSLSPLFSNNNNNNSNNNNNKNNNSNSNSNNNNNSNSSTSNTSHTNYSNTSNINRTPKVDKLEKSDRIDNESINPLSIDINQLLMETQDFEFSDEEDGSNTPSDTIDIIRSNGKTLHRASSISSTSTFQSAKSSWTDGQSLMEENIMGHESINTTNKEQVLLNTNDENWEVNSACSSTSGFYSAQEEFYDA